MDGSMVSTAQNVIFKESALEEVQIAVDDSPGSGAEHTLNREYMKPVREYLNYDIATADGIIFFCPGQNKKQAAFLAAQAYMLIQKNTVGEEICAEDDDWDYDEFFQIYEREEQEQMDNSGRSLFVIDYHALFEPTEDTGGEIAHIRKMQSFGSLIENCRDILLVCEGTVEADHLLHTYQTLDVQNKTICFCGQVDEFLIRHITFELRTDPEQFLELRSPTGEEYGLFLKQYLEANGYPAEKIAAPLLRKLMNYRKDFFTERDIYHYLGSKMESWKKKGIEIPMADDFEFTYSGRKEKPAVQELEELIGLEGVKEQVKRTVVAQFMSEFSGTPIYGHMIFAGRPGTAKTTCARLYNRILAEYSLSNGRFVEAGRADMIGAYLGQTAPKIAELFRKANGGMLFIDEAGFLQKTDAREDGYVREAVTELVRNLENNPQTRVIFATYPEYAEGVLEADPGLSSRLRVLEFPSYSMEELMRILYKMAEDRKILIEPSQRKGVERAVRSYLRPMMDCDDFGNGREIRKIMETALEECGMMLLYRQSGQMAPWEVAGQLSGLREGNNGIVLTAEHFEKAAAHLNGSKASLGRWKKQCRQIGFALSEGEEVRG